ncbi:hypothetical protein [Ensifer sp. LC163]|uniref:hypothetical protein n=1 Tax=Ensifer sp. LC163 TaxID=1120652 RepID=UPI0008134DE8|nr:hypothetical protein [Ensifer sp. LC163]OCP35055.1 hypothetical protein BC360_28660 [Ensifer sp. LC163]
MLFNIEHDNGDVIEGYLIPDGFAEIPTIVVSDVTGPIIELQCTHVRQSVIDAGRHGGPVGFRLDLSIIPNLIDCEGLAIHDSKTGILVYRRPRVKDPIHKKILRLETQLIPHLRLDAYYGRNFQYELSSIERYGHETTLQVFHLNTIDSIYLSGRLLMRNYEEFFDKGFSAIVMLTDPYYEMATRLYVLKRMSKIKIPFLGDRDQLILGAAVDYFEPVMINDERSLRQALKHAPQKVRNVFLSPTTRQLACTSPEQPVTRADVAPAIDLLSRFTVVGHQSEELHFQQAVGELLNLPADGMQFSPKHSELERIAENLRAIPFAEQLLEQDLIFDHYVRQAMSPMTAQEF